MKRFTRPIGIIQLLASIITIAVVLAAAFWQLAIAQSNEGDTPQETPIERAPSGLYLTYQGQLHDTSGQLLDETAAMHFELYPSLEGGTACQGWSETHSVAVVDGVFSVVLGRSSAIPDSCLINDIYLQVNVNGEPLAPREQLSSWANTMPANTTTRGSLNVNGKLHTTNGIEIGLQANGGGRLVVANNSNDNNIYVEAFSSDMSSSADMLAFTGRFAQPAPRIVLNGTSVETTGELLASGGMVTVVNPNNLAANFGLSWRNDIARIRVGGDGAGANNGFEFQGIGDASLLRIHANGNVDVPGALSVGSCASASLNPDALAADACTAGSIQGGAYVETNLQTVAERLNGGNPAFERGDVLCWGDNRLELCTTARTPMVQGVADSAGNPIVLGAEPVKVIGLVKTGQYLVASNVPGYAMAVDDPTFGVVIAQALEDFNGERGVILAMIRKM